LAKTTALFRRFRSARKRKVETCPIINTMLQLEVYHSFDLRCCKSYFRSTVLEEFAEEHRIKRELSKGGEDMLPHIGWPEALLFLLIVLLLFGASRLRDIGGAMGGAIRDFRSALSGADEEQDKGEKEEEKIV
jgi:sec-independent protein translocase protein TatA